jgi:hypothetical protein
MECCCLCSSLCQPSFPWATGSRPGESCAKMSSKPCCQANAWAATLHLQDAREVFDSRETKRSPALMSWEGVACRHPPRDHNIFHGRGFDKNLRSDCAKLPFHYAGRNIPKLDSLLFSGQVLGHERKAQFQLLSVCSPWLIGVGWKIGRRVCGRVLRWGFAGLHFSDINGQEGLL